MIEERLVATIEQRRSGARVIKFAGVLDEHNRLDQLIAKLGAGKALINLAGVERINSSGIRDWMNWLASLEAKGIRPVFIACSPAIVDCLNRIKKFAGGGIVKSVNVPYHCSTCSLDKLLLVHLADMGTPPYQAPECMCDGCGQAMLFVDDANDYFAFVEQMQKMAEPKDEPARVARGSNSAVTKEHVQKISQPRLPSRGSRPSLSAFQLPDGVKRPSRPSEHDLHMPAPMPPSERPWLIAIVVLLLCTLGVLAFVLLGR